MPVRKIGVILWNILLLTLICSSRVAAAQSDAQRRDAAVWTVFPVAEQALQQDEIPLIRWQNDRQTLLTINWEKDATSWFGVSWYIRVRSEVPLGGGLIDRQIWTQYPAAGHEYELMASYTAEQNQVVFALIDRTTQTLVAGDVVDVENPDVVAPVLQVPEFHTVIAQAAVFIPFAAKWHFGVSLSDGGFQKVSRVTGSEHVYIVSPTVGQTLTGTFRLVDVGTEKVVGGLSFSSEAQYPAVSAEAPAGGAHTYRLEYEYEGQYWPLGLQELEVVKGSVQVGIRDARVIDGQAEGLLVIRAKDITGDVTLQLNAALSTWRFRGAYSRAWGERTGLWTAIITPAEGEIIIPFAFPAPEITTEELSLVKLTLQPQVSGAYGYLVSTTPQAVWYYARLETPAGDQPVEYPDRKTAAQRQRRVIYNNDGLDYPGAQINPVTFLERRTVGFEQTMVDTIFYCDGIFNLYTHRSDETELLNGPGTTRPEWQPWAWELQRQGFDTLQLVIDYAKANNLEIFWAVREKAFRIVEDVVRRYDVDGIELDFLRFPVFFKPQMLGEPVTDAQRALMTDWLKRVRTMVDEVAAERGKPILIAVRVHDAVGYNFESGLDLGAWLENDLVDMIIAGDYFRLQPWEHIVSFAAPYGVPVYACISAARFPADDILPWRAEALRAWEAGVAGIYTFNIFNVNHPAFSELGDPELLRRLPRSDVFEPTADNLRNVASYKTFLRGGERYLHPETAATYPQYFGWQ